MMFLFKLLARRELEFGFRSAHEITRYISLARGIEANLPWEREFPLLKQAFDEQICQKILPRLYGSRKHLEPLLLELGAFCGVSRDWSSFNTISFVELQNSIDVATQTGQLTQIGETPFLPISYDKIVRLLDRARRNGFASFAEA
jgi:hypothetical protein